MKRYTIIRLDPSGNGTDVTIAGDLTWEQALNIMAGAKMNIDYALASLEYKQWYSFLDEDDNICELRECPVNEGSDDINETGSTTFASNKSIDSGGGKSAS